MGATAPGSKVQVRVYCDEPGAYHERRKRTAVRDFWALRDGTWTEADNGSAYSVRVLRNEEESTNKLRRRPSFSVSSHGNYELSCGCGLSLRAHQEDVWPIFTELEAHDVSEISLRNLIILRDRMRRK